VREHGEKFDWFRTLKSAAEQKYLKLFGPKAELC